MAAEVLGLRTGAAVEQIGMEVLLVSPDRNAIIGCVGLTITAPADVEGSGEVQAHFGLGGR